jgi:DNA-binding NarL/FixJ family response regulator
MKILIADDHALFREGLRHVLALLADPTPEVVEAADFESAAAVAGAGGIDLVLLDLGMPGGAWEDGLAAIKATLPPEVPVVILSASDDRRRVMAAVNAGAAGFIPKTSSSRVMLSALKLVLSGGVYLPPAMLDQAVDLAMDDHAAGGIAGLTPRQREVLSLLGEGKSNKEIARVLQLAEGTVKLHVTAILKNLGVNNRTRAVVAASQLGLAVGV